MSSTLCQDFGPIRLLNCPFNSPGTTNDSQAATDNCEDNSGGSVDMSVWKACGECVPLSVLCTMYGSILSVMYGTSWREQDLKSLPSVRTECGNKVREMIATAGTEHHHFFSLILPALFLPWLIREQVGCDLKLVEHTCLRAAPLIHVEPTIAPAPPVCMPAASTVISTTVSRLTHSRPPFPFSSSFQMFGFIWWL